MDPFDSLREKFRTDTLTPDAAGRIITRPIDGARSTSGAEVEIEVEAGDDGVPVLLYA
jgi:hypothetical protein